MTRADLAPIIQNVQPVITAAQMREVDRLTIEQYATPSLLLMEAAAAAILRTISSRFSEDLAGKKARILCGPGNNGGDGAALARQLAGAGVHTDVILFGRIEQTKDDARANFQAAKRLASFEAGSTSQPSPITFVECDGISAWEELAGPSRNYDILVDALFGTGLTRPLAGVYIQVIEHLALIRRARNRAGGSRPLIVSLDVPSGLNADVAVPIGPAVEADVTVTFTAPKPANVLPPASFHGGVLEIANIGSPAVLLEAIDAKLFLVEPEDARSWLVRTRYTADSYKNRHGHVLVIGGSPDYSGAAALCGNAAMRSGAGLVTVAVPASAQSSVAARAIPEVMTTALAETDRGAVSDAAIDHALQLAMKASVVAVGPGLTATDERTRRFVRGFVEGRTTPVVIDADALNCLAPWPAELRGSTALPLILTPHPGEMARLIGSNSKTPFEDRVATARAFAVQHEVIVLLKGSRSLVAAPDGRVFINSTGNAGLGTAGAGDTLTGLVAGFIAQAVETLKDEGEALSATIAALYVGGLAGDLAARGLGMRTMVASDIREHFSAAIRSLDIEGEQP
ncbi:MAG: yjeF C-terminal region, hydroxyethylthiazole kinaserelated/yjeF N-terminal region [Acidobacteria bacterium]|nr:yjeF C-terminal region, hydroxyethylthiazole kinaserelated/yjeF N-terminal region [Acidobacteriota bacterium]